MHYNVSPSHRQKKGASMVRVLWVLAVIFFVAGGIVLALKAGQETGKERNQERTEAVTMMLDAIHEYSKENSGVLPAGITEKRTEICATGQDCEGLIDLPELTQNKKYLSALPVDPSHHSSHGTGYEISRTENGRVTVGAPHAEMGETICITR